MEKSKGGSFDFHKLHKTEDFVTYQYNYPKFKSFLEAELKKHPSKQIYFIILDYVKPTFSNAAMSLSYISQFPIPILIKQYLDWIDDESAGQAQGWYLTLAVLLLSLVKPVIFHQSIRMLNMTTSRVQSLIRSMLVDKTLNMPPGVQAHLDAGKLSTLVTSDMKKISTSVMTRSHLFTGPALVVLYSGVLYLELEWVGLLAPVIIFIIAWIQIKIN